MKKMIEERLLSDSDEGLGLEIKEVPEKVLVFYFPHPSRCHSLKLSTFRL